MHATLGPDPVLRRQNRCGGVQRLPRLERAVAVRRRPKVTRGSAGHQRDDLRGEPLQALDALHYGLAAAIEDQLVHADRRESTNIAGDILRLASEAGIRLVPDQSQRAAEKEILEGLGFAVIEITPAPFAQASDPAAAVSRTSGAKMNDFGRLLEKEIPRLRRNAFGLTATCPGQTTSSRTPSSRQLRSNVTGSGYQPSRLAFHHYA
jgi:hypothetical protein